MDFLNEGGGDAARVLDCVQNGNRRIGHDCDNTQVVRQNELPTCDFRYECLAGRDNRSILNDSREGLAHIAKLLREEVSRRQLRLLAIEMLVKGPLGFFDEIRAHCLAFLQKGPIAFGATTTCFGNQPSRRKGCQSVIPRGLLDAFRCTKFSLKFPRVDFASFLYQTENMPELLIERAKNLYICYAPVTF